MKQTIQQQVDRFIEITSQLLKDNPEADSVNWTIRDLEYLELKDFIGTKDLNHSNGKLFTIHYELGMKCSVGLWTKPTKFRTQIIVETPEIIEHESTLDDSQG